MIQIIPYEEKFAADFRLLNQQWLTEYGLLESHDLDVIMDPQATILDKGGYIFLAASEGSIVGSAGLMKESDEVYELVKMAVVPAHRRKGIGRLLIEKSMDRAREAGARKLFLFSNSRLRDAIRLYEKFGFVHVPVTGSPFDTADVKMEIWL